MNISGKNLHDMIYGGPSKEDRVAEHMYELGVKVYQLIAELKDEKPEDIMKLLVGSMEYDLNKEILANIIMIGKEFAAVQMQQKEEVKKVLATMEPKMGEILSFLEKGKKEVQPEPEKDLKASVDTILAHAEVMAEIKNIVAEAEAITEIVSAVPTGQEPEKVSPDAEVATKGFAVT